MSALVKNILCQLAGWALLVLSAAVCLTAIAPSSAWGLSGCIDVVDDDSFAPDGYDWHFEFTGVEAERGFVACSDISQYYSDMCVGNFVKEGDDGFAAFIDSSTPADQYGESTFALRYTGGSYTDEDGVEHDIDALVELTGWTYRECEGGFTNDPFLKAHPQKTWASGVFINNVYSPNISERTKTHLDLLTNLNFFTVELSNLTVKVTYVEAGTDQPIRVKGHSTCNDVDCNQSFSFSGGVVGAEVCASSQTDCGTGAQWLSIDSSKTKVTGNGDIEADNSDQHYQNGMVATYFDTGSTGEDGIVLNFFTTLSSGHRTSISFFAMTSEYLANPSKFSCVLTKTATQTTVSEGGYVDYMLATALPVEGNDVRIGYRLSELSVTDELPSEITLTGAMNVAIDGSTLKSDEYTCSVENGVLTMALDEDFLSGLELNGQELSIWFDAYVTDLPDPDDEGKYYLKNIGQLIVGGGDPIDSNTSIVEVIPLQRTGSITVTKQIKADEVYWEHGNPTFIVHVIGTDQSGTQHAYAALMTFTPEQTAQESGYYELSQTFSDIPLGSYRVSESPTLRYVTQSVTTNGEVAGNAAQIDLSTTSEGLVTFTNATRSYQDGSHCDAVANHVTANAA